MIIAVDTRDNRVYGRDLFLKVAKDHPQHIFIFILAPLNSSLNFPENIIPVIIKDPKITLLSQVINDQKISFVLKKYKADVYLSEKYLPNAKVAQCLIGNKEEKKTGLQKAKVVVVDSQFSKQEIIKKCKIEEDKICVVHPGVGESFNPVDPDNREKLKEEYAEGNEYFLSAAENAGTNNLLNLLKAFSIFKKRLKSSMQLLIISRNKLHPEFIEQLRLYKLKSEIKIYENIDENQLPKITASAYAMIHLADFAGFNIPPLTSIKCNVPVIVTEKSKSAEICGNAALYVNPADNKDIAEKMMLIYKDEKLRQQIIEKGKQQIEKYSWDKAADSLWQSIIKATA